VQQEQKIYCIDLQLNCIALQLSCIALQLSCIDLQLNYLNFSVIARPVASSNLATLVTCVAIVIIEYSQYCKVA
jgi:hypothetical protein